LKFWFISCIFVQLPSVKVFSFLRKQGTPTGYINR